MRDFNALFIELATAISNECALSLPKEFFKIKTQEEDSQVDIPDLGKIFGTIYDKKGDLLLANWLFDLSEKERKILIEFLLIRESFKLLYKIEMGNGAQKYERFSDIIVQTIAMLYYCTKKKIPLHSAPMIAIKGRADAFTEEDILKSEYWVYFLVNSIQIEISPIKLFQIVINRVKDAIQEDRPLYELAWDVMYWLKAHIPEKVSDGLPFYIEKKRHFELLITLCETKFEDCSATNIGKILNRSYNVVNRDFQQIMDKYELFWWANVNLIKLRLYPFIFRVNLTNKEHTKHLIEKLKKYRYIRNIRECELKEKATIVGWLDSPLIVSEQIATLFEKLQMSDIVEEFFIKQIKRRTICWSITNKKLTPNEETYNLLFTDPKKLNCKTITALDEEYNVLSKKREKKELFNEDILMFISTVMTHHIGKSHYKFMPMETFYELCEKNKIDSTNTTDVTYYINQLDMRSRRLGAYRYFLYFRRQGDFKKALYIEINLKENPIEKIKDITNRLSSLCEIEQLVLNNQIILIFPEVKQESILGRQIESILKDNDITYTMFQLNYHRNLKVELRFNFHNAYDFLDNNWINS